MPVAIWTPIAEEELDDILYYQDHRYKMGEKIFHEIHKLVNVQAQSSLPGRIHSASPDGWFYLQYKQWLIFYKPHSTGIEIMRVTSGFGLYVAKFTESPE